jgi:RNA polymerase sigma-70 factor (ECF subfamily)
LALLDRVFARLREEYHRKGQESHFDRMRPFLTGDQERGRYQQLAVELNATEGAARTAVHRLRRRFGELVRDEISATVADPAEVEGEIAFLLTALQLP